MKKLLLYFNTVKFLKPSQIFFSFFSYENIRLIREPFALRELKSKPYFLSNENAFKDNSFTFLNEKKKIKGNPFEIKAELLWVFNLNYFDYLLSDLNTKKCNDFIEDWFNLRRDDFRSSAWHPYPSSLRAVNFIKYHLTKNKIEHKFLNILYFHGHLILKRIEYRVLGNHLIKNLKALIFCGCFFKTRKSDYWLDFAMKRLMNELDDQLLSDGLHFERTPAYHNQVLEDLVDILIILKSYSLKDNECKKIKESISKMLYRSHRLNHPDGDVSFFNDSVFGMSKKTDDIESLIKKNNLRIDPLKTESKNFLSRAFGDFFLILNLSSINDSYQPAHSHADNLSFELSFKNKRIIVNSGISTYEDSNLRNYQRSSKAHNMITLDDENTSEVWSAFRVARRVNTKILNIEDEKNFLKVVASYEDLNRSKVERRFKITNSKLKVMDKVANSNKKKITYLHLSPDVYIENDKDQINILMKGEQIFTLIHDYNHFNIENTYWYPSFGTAIPNLTLKFISSAKVEQNFFEIKKLY